MRVIAIMALVVSACSGCAGEVSRVDWSWGPVAPLARTSRATAAVGDSIVTVVGTFWKSADDGTQTKIWTNAVYALDVKELNWQALPDLPKPAGYAFAAGVGNKLYVVGGTGEKQGNTEVFILDTSSADPKWTSGPSLPRPRWGHEGGVIDGVIYIAGGLEGEPPTGNGRAAGDVLALDTRDTSRGWGHIADFPDTETRWQVGTVCSGRLYAFGGIEITPDGELIPRREAFCLDLSSGQWQQIAPLPMATGAGACIAIDSRRVLIAGGLALAVPPSKSPDGKPRWFFTTTCLLYDTEQDTYQPLTPLHEGIAHSGLVLVGDTLYCLGGEQTARKTRSDLVQIGKLRCTGGGVPER